MGFKNCVIYLIGFQGVGKLSIAREICKQADFRLIDNHAINKLVFPMVRFDGKSTLPPEIWGATRRIREIVLETMVELGIRELNFVFTNVLLEGEANSEAVYRQVEKAVLDREGCFIPVRVWCDEVEHEKRIVVPSRELDWKQTEGSVVTLLHREKEPLKPRHSHTISIDVTNLSAAESATIVLKQASAIYEGWRNDTRGFSGARL